MQVLVAAAECAPWSRESGVADAITGLVDALHNPTGTKTMAAQSMAAQSMAAKAGVAGPNAAGAPDPVDVHVITPMYRCVWRTALQLPIPPREVIPARDILVGDQRFSMRVMEVMQPRGQPHLWFVDCPALFDRGGLYADSHDRRYSDNPQRFAAFCNAVLDFAPRLLGRAPDLVHCHDWPTALIPIMLEARDDPFWDQTDTLLTIHDVREQGVFPRSAMEQMGLPWSLFRIDGVEFWGKVNALKGGLIFADGVNTVNRATARLLQTSTHGGGLEGVLADRPDSLVGIEHGLDTRSWDPAFDTALATPFSHEDLSGRSACRKALTKKMAMRGGEKQPIFGLLGPFSQDCGTDLVCEVADTVVQLGGRLVMHGDGDAALRDRLLGVSVRLRADAALVIGQDEELERMILGGVDVMLIPARWAPSSNVHLRAMLYGALPIVADDGTLADAVVEATPENISAGTATGFRFDASDADGLHATVRRAVACFHDRPVDWHTMMVDGMRRDFSWAVAAAEYEALFRGMRGG